MAVSLSAEGFRSWMTAQVEEEGSISSRKNDGWYQAGEGQELFWKAHSSCPNPRSAMLSPVFQAFVEHQNYFSFPVRSTSGAEGRIPVPRPLGLRAGHPNGRWPGGISGDWLVNYATERFQDLLAVLDIDLGAGSTAELDALLRKAAEIPAMAGVVAGFVQAYEKAQRGAYSGA